MSKKLQNYHVNFLIRSRNRYDLTKDLYSTYIFCAILVIILFTFYFNLLQKSTKKYNSYVIKVHNLPTRDFFSFQTQFFSLFTDNFFYFSYQCTPLTIPNRFMKKFGKCPLFSIKVGSSSPWDAKMQGEKLLAHLI